MEKLRHLDLFSGIGGFSLGVEATGGFETIGFSEIEPYCCAVLKKHWPKVKNYGDIRAIPRVECDIITGGFPCQPFSCAGQQRGASDDRHLWPAMCDVIKASRPTWVIGENVAGIIEMELDNCIADLEKEGYTVQPIIIPACAVDARHRRDRVWIIANRLRGAQCAELEIKCDSSREKIIYRSGEINADIKSAGLKGSDATRNPRALRQLGEFRQAVSNDGQIIGGASGPDEIKTGTAKTLGRGNSEIDGDAASAQRERRTGKIMPSERRPPFGLSEPSRWPAEPGLGRMVHGLSRGSHESKIVQKRLEALGNTIVPQIAQIIGEIILNIKCGTD